VSQIELGSGLVLTIANPAGTFTDAIGTLTASFTYDASTGEGTIHYSYGLLDNTLGSQNPSFAVAVTDADGDRTVGGNLVISIVDDVPVATADTDSVAAGQTAPESGNVLTGVGTISSAADMSGADGGVSVASVAVGSGASVNVDPTIGATIAGAFGTLTLLADGSYSYARAIGIPGGAHTDTFTYTITDADGSQSSATLAIAVADSTPGDIAVPPPDEGETTVFEAGLPARTIAGVAEPGGSNPVAPTAVSGTISFTSLDGVSKIELGGLTLDGSNNFSGTFSDTTGTSSTPGFVRTACEIASLIENDAARASRHTRVTSKTTTAVRNGNCIQPPVINGP
jgi:VCBS repeat-containing protein